MPQSGVTPSIAATYDSQLRANCAAGGNPVPNTPSSGTSVASPGDCPHRRATSAPTTWVGWIESWGGSSL